MGARYSPCWESDDPCDRWRDSLDEIDARAATTEPDADPPPAIKPAPEPPADQPA